MTMRSGTKSLGARTPHRALSASQVLVVLLLCAGGLLPGGPVHAQAPETSHDYTFGQTATFALELPAESTVEQATFYLQANRAPTTGIDAHVTDGRTEITRNLVVEPLPPYANLTYWWSYDDDAGGLVETERVSFQYIDNRYVWQLAEGDGLTVHWVTGERSRMIQAVDVAETALRTFQEALGTDPVEGTDIYLYPSQTDLASAMQLAGFDWAGGVAYPELGVVLVAIPPTVDAPLMMQQDIPHELTHRALYDWLGSQGYAALPTWLNEGLAMAFEMRPDPLRAVVIEEAHISGNLIPLAELCQPFPDDPQRAELAYAQSERIVAYLRQTYGWSGLRRLILAYADGKACNAGMLEGIEQDLVAVDRAWRISLEQSQGTSGSSAPRPEATLLWRDAGPWLVVLAALLLPGLSLVAERRR